MRFFNNFNNGRDVCRPTVSIGGGVKDVSFCS